MFLIRDTIDPRRWALSWRLSAYFAGATSVIVFGVMWVMYGQLTGQLHEKDEIELGDTLKVQLGILKEIDSGKEPVLWQREWTENALRNEKVLLRVIEPNGGVYSASPGFATPMELFPPASNEGGFRRIEGNRGKTSRISTSYLLTARSLEVLPDRVWTVQAVLDTSSSDRILEKYRERLILMMCAAIFVSCGVGWVLVRRGLAPLREMNSAIAGIDSRRLHARIADQAWPFDLRELAQSFDDMLRRLEIAFEQLSRFSSNLAHEFRSPITNLVAAASVMLSRERTAAEYQETLAVVVEEGERLSRMVSSMLFLARAENAKQALQPEAVSVAVEFSKMRDAFEGLADERGIQILTEGDATLHVDPMLLRRALHNLIANALAHTPHGGTVTLSAGNTAQGVEVAVADNGTGIEEQHLPLLFDRFYRADASRSSSENSGLGLAIVKSIAELHGGEVSVSSTVGHGARFVIRLPADTGKADIAGPAAP